MGGEGWGRGGGGEGGNVDVAVTRSERGLFVGWLVA